MRRGQTLTGALARAGFARLSEVGAALAEAADLSGWAEADLVEALTPSADPDAALDALVRLLRIDPERTRAVLGDGDARHRLARVLGSSAGLADFLARHPAELDGFARPLAHLPAPGDVRDVLLRSVGAVEGVAATTGAEARAALRIRYRALVARVAAWDLVHPDPLVAVRPVTAALADLAGAALEASLAVARAELSSPGTFGRARPEEIAATRLAVIGMGKAGARELNYVSDVDVIFVAEAALDADGEPVIEPHRAVELATRLAVLTMRGIDEHEVEPALWEVDANLRPEGKAGALVRTLDSHLAYYDRWAKDWEFQALLKARPLAGDAELGDRYAAAVAPLVWSSASREGFVGQVQRMRTRVTDNIPADQLHQQIKLGPGGIRDIEFTVQLLQLVHGQTDEEVRQRGTLPALVALADAGYIGRVEAGDFARDYRYLRLLEHRLQLERLHRTHLMPVDEERLRALARSTGLDGRAEELVARWTATKTRVRTLHERLFYRPLLAAVASLPEETLALTSDQAAARLSAIGFVDARGALGHIRALSQGVSRSSAIQRHLLPVLLQWFADGPDPDHGLLAFRRLSEALGEATWFLRMLRDSAGAAQRLTQVLSGSRYVSELLDRVPEAAAWLARDEDLRPRSRAALDEEALATVNRHPTADAAAAALRTLRRREVLRLAIGAIVGVTHVETLGPSLAAITTVTLRGVMRAIRREDGPWPEYAVVAMGRYGGAELGFGSDADVMHVYRPIAGMDPDLAQRRAQLISSELTRLTEDSRLPLDLDTGLRPEGRNGPVVRSFASYRAYYERWSLTWEAQALLRARGVVGDSGLIADFTELADRIRYPSAIGEADVREIKRIKARVENERLPQGADPTRHLKLGRGSLSDVEWLVQLLQLQHAHRHPALRTPTTLGALDAAVEAGLVEAEDAGRLRDAWLLASRVRSAMTLWTNRTADVLPADRAALDAIARLLEYPPGSASVLEEEYLGVTRRSRAVFERLFYGLDDRVDPLGS
ncbi:bifunctional [glutamine synthetase] adenylyltransferase/[glutamine synthetase]-adenylyl-L-tyrosine phosphorylase [Clavibacter tessellarius]|uniref:Bifunctional glutamine synthetase adenylyltransferase/adenylyl-removing enzyme n=1 Tax=Clavibacter tessellarius TaxID=31965 RepID=A0A225CB37_9MICO|nr:bifunctional [glutamine synthetase] adenylyltransferase/[glutamine synthetase]-adenylyl-L-tyrosine phosphorylase [Clavibacter michiganensis]OQJ63739.1 bifunctional glutamine-synthetase adenylyltransferase/deadenyltransferase [Clavibacter michiganensis subsp. tessellarius]UKF33282.1 bifunctional [glutamine synthetase] adenylyltransferase/[glutamine synthetase]-adenylyl-L-tyrosine phosphorylase [Clavibacter michiganensis subsp. tessellarius]